MGRPCGIFNTRYEQDRAILRTPHQWGMFIAFLIALFTVPHFLSGHLIYLGIRICVTIIAMLGLQIMLGYTFQVHLGLTAFIGMGAYVCSLLTYHLGFNFFPAMVIGALGAAVYGLIIGTSMLRVKGIYLIIPTISALFLFYFLINEVLKKWTFGTDGIEAATPTIFGFAFNTDVRYFYLVAVIALLLGIGTRNLVRSKIGRAWIAIRDNDIGAECLGINIFYYKLLAFAIGNAFAGISGALWAHYVTYHNTEFYSINETVWYVGFCIVGGFGYVNAAVFGAVFYRLLEEVVNFTGPLIETMLGVSAGTFAASFGLIVFGVVVIAFLIFEPRGLAHRWEIFKRSYRLHPFAY